MKLSVIGSDVIVGSIHVSDESGKTIAELDGFTCRAAGTMAVDQTKDWLYTSELEACPLAAEAYADQTNDFIPAMDDILEQIGARAEKDTKREPWGDIYRQRKPEIDHLCQVYIRQALVNLGWDPEVGDVVNSNQLAKELSIAEERRRVLDRFLEILAEDGLVSKEGENWGVCDWPEIEDGNQVWREAVESFPAYHIEYRIVRRFGQNLAECLNGETDPVQLLFNQNDNLARDFYTRGWNIRRANAMLCEAVQSLIDRLPEGRKLRISNSALGTGGTTEWVLPMLPADSASYVFTDITAHFLSKAEERFGDYEFVDYKVFNLEHSPLEQGFAPSSFDLVIASNVIHATADLDVTLGHIREVIAPGALVAFLELTNPPRWLDLVFGLMDGWWAMTDERAKTLTPLLQADQWIAQLKRCGFDTPQTAESIDGCCAVVLGREPKLDEGKLVSCLLS